MSLMQCHRRCHPQALRQLQEGNGDTCPGKKRSTEGVFFFLMDDLFEKLLTLLLPLCVTCSMTLMGAVLLWM